MNLDLNCDLGEGEPVARTRALMRCITSANVACGGHAGDTGTMQTCVRLAEEYGVRLGAHPGLWNRGDFGRGAVRLTPNQLELLLLHQVSALERIAGTAKIKLHHLKLHGALYHASEADDKLAHCYLATVARWWPGVRIYARVGGRIARMAKRTKVEVWEEAFADRAYRNDGSLLPRGEPGAVLTNIQEVVERAKALFADGATASFTGKLLPLQAHTICVHSDTPHAVELAQRIARLLR